MSSNPTIAMSAGIARSALHGLPCMAPIASMSSAPNAAVGRFLPRPSSVRIGTDACLLGVGLVDDDVGCETGLAHDRLVARRPVLAGARLAQVMVMSPMAAADQKLRHFRRSSNVVDEVLSIG